MSEELKPCPFCGAELIEAHSFASRSSKTFVHPVIESADGSDAACPGNHLIVNTGRPESIAAWNRRAPSPDMREAVEALTMPSAIDELRAAIEAFEANCIAVGGYKPAIATLLRIIADEMADKYPDDTNDGRAALGRLERERDAFAEFHGDRTDLIVKLTATEAKLAKAERALEEAERVIAPFAHRCDEAVRPDDTNNDGVTVKTRHLRAARKWMDERHD